MKRYDNSKCTDTKNSQSENLLPILYNNQFGGPLYYLGKNSNRE